MDDGFEVMVTRVLEVDGELNFLIEVGKPWVENDGARFCPFRLAGPATRYLGRAGGVDGMQALLNALYTLDVKTETAIENKEGRLTWCGDSAHFGFPSIDQDPITRENRRLQGR